MISAKKFLVKHIPIILYGFSLSVLLFFLKWMQWRFLIVDNAIDIYIGLIAFLFTLLGIWVAGQFFRNGTKTVVVEKEIYVPALNAFPENKTELQKLNLSRREQEVLHLILKGMSNGEIADNLCLSLSTIKTHVSNIFGKMNVKSRAQAIAKAKGHITEPE